MNDRRQKIFFIIPNVNAGGAERVALTLLEHLDRRDYSYTLVVLDDGKGALADQIPKDVRIITLGKTRVRSALFAIIRLVWKERPALIFSNLSHLNLMLSIFRFLFPRNVKFIARESNIISKNVLLFNLSAVWQRLYILFYGHFDRVVCQSSEMKNDLIKTYGFPATKAVVIPNPVNVNQIRSLAEAGTAPKHSVLTFVACGRLDFQKGFDILIDALALANLDNVLLMIIGDGVLRKELVQKAKGLGVENKVSFLGFQSNPYPFFKQADAFILSSRFEGMPNVVLESVALGTPVIATPAPGGVVEFLSNIDGCIISSDITAESLAASIVTFSDRTVKTLSTDITDQLAAPKVAQQYENEFRKVLACG
ncbi:glycosyltransferase [Candidatus Puniceispirillum sp.]|uniref:glycosyltransferase n=1 Tax=Candidatus Puniceispirillum sp. TaxID=2026719 RepID=UPI003F6987D5